jgi:hypothetical protein
MSIVSRSTQQYSGFDPRSIPGCALWLDSADSNVVTIVGTEVRALNDKSGNGYHMNILTPNVNDYVGSTVFQTAVFPTVGARINGLATTSMSASAGLRQDRTINNIKSFFWVGRQKSTDVSFLFGHRDYYDFHGNSIAFIDLGNTLTNNYSSPGIAGATARLFAGGSGSAATFSNVSLPAVDANFMLSVEGITGSTTRFEGICFDRIYNPGWVGDIGEVLVFNTVLTDAQRRQVEGYLANKWGLRTNLPVGHPFRLSPVLTRPFVPVDLDGCALWLDAADSSALNVSSRIWSDKSGNGNNVILDTNISIVSLNGKNALRCTNSYSTYTNPYIFANGSGATVFIIIKDTPTTSANGSPLNSFVNGYGGSHLTWFGNSTVQTSSVFTPIGSDVRISFNDVQFSTTNTAIFGQTSGGTTNELYRNGVLLATDGASYGTGFMARSYNIDAWTGTMGEMIIFKRKLSANERQITEGYLAAKWGLSTSLPTTQPYFSLRSLPSTPLFVPTTLSNLALWLDATDPNGNGTVPVVNSAVTTWIDKSTAGANATSVGTTPTYASDRGILFSAGAYNTAYSASLTNESLFVVFNYTRTSGTSSLVGQTGNGARLLSIGAGASTGRLESSVYNVANGSVSPTTTIPINTIGLGELVTSNSSMSIFYNGTSVGTPTSVTFTSGRTSVIGGASNAGAINTLQYHVGTIYEVLGYTRVLSAYERQQVEGYLAWKWGLQQALPAPFARTIASPLSITGCALWLDAADTTSSSMTFSTGSNISAWKDKSSNALTSTIVNGALSVANIQNNLSVVRLNGTNQYFDFGNVLNLGTNGLSIFFVGKFSSNAGEVGMIGKTSYRGNTARWALGYNSVYSSGIFTLVQESGDLTRQQDFAYNPNNAFTIYSTYNDRTSSAGIFANGGSTSNIATFTGTAANLSNSDSLYIGSYPDGTGSAPQSGMFYNGDISEVIVYFAQLSTAQRQQVEAYLQAKWNIAVPVAHPYKNFRA